MKTLILFIFIFGSIGSPGEVYAESRKLFSLQPASGDCVVSVDLAHGSSVKITAPDGNLEGTYIGISTSGDCSSVFGSALTSAINNNSILDGHLRERGGEGVISDTVQPSHGNQLAGDPVGTDELADVLLQNLESQIILSAFIGSKSNEDEGANTYLQNLGIDANGRIKSLTRQIGDVAKSADFSGNSALAERLRSRVNLFMSDRDSLEKRLKVAISDEGDVRKYANLIQNQLISAAIVACLTLIAVLMGFLWMRRRRRMDYLNGGGVDDWKLRHRADLHAQFELMQWIPYATIFLLLTGGFLALSLGLNSSDAGVAAALTTSLGACVGLLLAALGAIKWRGEIAKQLKEW